jgi:hypothetical protein
MTTTTPAAVAVAYARDAAEAEFLKDLLRAAGVPATVRALPGDVLVAPADARRAHDLLVPVSR